jgi:hypothetical protein
MALTPNFSIPNLRHRVTIKLALSLTEVKFFSLNQTKKGYLKIATFYTDFKKAHLASCQRPPQKLYITKKPPKLIHL